MNGVRDSARTRLSLLLVDDDNDLRNSIARRLKRQGHTVIDAGRPTDGVELARMHHFEVALVDLSMPEMDGIEFLRRLKEIDSSCQVVMLTGQATVETAVQAMKLGAFDYVTKPCPFDELELIIEKAWEHYRLIRENASFRVALERAAPSSEIVGTSAAICKVLRLVDKAAPTGSPILILGESGTGKELIARAIHRKSQRAARPMVTINCAALQETLLESELFGHEKGAFTGAVSDKPGLFEVAHGGTFFVDELGELAAALQAKLLRVLEDGTLRRVGSTREKRVDVRVIAATNRDLRRDVGDGRFRDDLFFRINVMCIELPPLRDRREDIPLLVEHFLRRSGAGNWKIAEDAARALCGYDWPGNVRELANILERATILADEHLIRIGDLPDLIVRCASSDHSLIGDSHTIDNLEERERRHVAHVLRRENWNRNRTAAALGINRRSLYRLIKKYGIEQIDNGNACTGGYPSQPQISVSDVG